MHKRLKALPAPVRRLALLFLSVAAVLGLGVAVPMSASASSYVWSSVKKCYWDVYTPNQYVNVQVRLHTTDTGSRSIDAVSFSGDAAVGHINVDELNSAGALIDSWSKDINASSYTFYNLPLGTVRGSSYLKARVRMNQQSGGAACLDGALGGNFGVSWGYAGS